MKSITVFCGSSMGNSDIYKEAAIAVGKALAIKGITVIYGGAKVGLMGAVADAALANNGEVIGVLPNFLSNKEIAHTGLTELIMTNDMHERKMKMHSLCEGIITLPGGFGSLEELFEMLTWGQLGLHTKPIGVLNIGGFYNGLLSCLNHMVAEGFLKQINRDMILVHDNIDTLLEAMYAYEVPPVQKWIKRQSDT
jgi:uncharacterized protein (TIGR00730 family)